MDANQTAKGDDGRQALEALWYAFQTNHRAVTLGRR